MSAKPKVSFRMITQTKSDAEICRENGWTVGTLLVGDESYGPTVIKLTAIGEDRILARQISHNGKPSDFHETSWTLCCRDWKLA